MPHRGTTFHDLHDPPARIGAAPVVLGVLQGLVGIAAVGVGAMLLVDSTGESLGVTVDLIAGSPFATYLVPGLALFLVNGVGSLVGAVLAFTRWGWDGPLAVALGAFLATFVALQVAWIGLLTPMQPITFGVGLAEMGLGALLWHRSARMGRAE